MKEGGGNTILMIGVAAVVIILALPLLKGTPRTGAGGGAPGPTATSPSTGWRGADFASVITALGSIKWGELFGGGSGGGRSAGGYNEDDPADLTTNEDNFWDF